MEGATVVIDLNTFIPMAGLVVAVLALVGGVFYRLGQLNNRVSELDRRFDRQVEDNRQIREELRQEFHQGLREAREEFRQELRDAREEFRQGLREAREEFRQEIREAKEELRQEIHEAREESRRNHQQLLQALAHHTHDPATGFAIFSIPPGTENPAG